jgi:hypothetical protein
MKLRYLLPLLWLLVLYAGTAATAGLDPAPDALLARILFEARHVLMHTAAFSGQITLVAWALRIESPQRRVWIGLAGLALALGVGQEAIQALLRGQVFPVNSAFDLLVDTAGGALGLLAWSRWMCRTGISQTKGEVDG